MEPVLPQAPPQVAPAEQDEHTRHRLLRCAVQVFDRKGYAAASVREIAELAGVAKPAVYYHFGSKEGLLTAILDSATREFGHTLAGAANRSGSARERLVALCLDVYGLFEANVPVARVAHSLFFGPSDSAPELDLAVFERRLRETVEGIVREGQAAGEIRQAPAGDVALAIMGVLDGCAGRQFHPALEAVGQDGLRRALNIVFDGIMANRRVQGDESR